ncbi:hypothetical protein [Butyrivibrio sp. WCE2006]|uniref:hypothetical protein n=1 Tax=Butyrivibrio sp. WCE2006 TaxID=1410611 RepID=UPI0012DE0E3A|nr:hypothetical protein [Butyrivibrio sp. WCE2006]
MGNSNRAKTLWIKVQRLFSLIMYLFSAGMLGFMAYLCFSPDIWYDELFSIQFALKPIPEMVKLTAADVHPPLYYIIAHFFVKIFGLLSGVFGGASGHGQGALDLIQAGNLPVYAAKFASLIPLIILYIYGLTIIRKRYGCLIGGMFSCAMIAMPQMSEYGVEIRMYSWVMLFVTALCIHARPFLESNLEKQIKGLKWKNILPVFIYGLLACYTQYYAAVAVAAVYVFLIILSIRKNIWQLGIILISANLTAVCYFPWIGVVLSQAKTVSGSYWIQPLGLRSIGGIIKYLLKPGFFNEKLATFLAVVIFILLCVLVITNIKDEYMWLCFMPIIGIIVFGFGASLLLRPVFVYRYMIPGMGALWFGVLEGIHERLKDGSRNSGKTVSYICMGLLGLMTVFCVRDFWAFRGNELYKRVNMVETQKVWDAIDENTVLICNFDQVAALSWYYSNGMTDVINVDKDQLPAHVYLYGGTTDVVLENMFSGISMIYEPSEVAELVENEDRVLFLGSFNSREDILKDWKEKAGIDCVNNGSFMNERYWFDVFELSLATGKNCCTYYCVREQ